MFSKRIRKLLVQSFSFVIFNLESTILKAIIYLGANLLIYISVSRMVSDIQR